MLAACDRELIGKKLDNGNFEVLIDPAFYKGELVDEIALGELLAEAFSINLFGKKAVDVAIKHGFLTEKGIIRIAGVEHAIILKG